MQSLIISNKSISTNFGVGSHLVVADNEFALKSLERIKYRFRKIKTYYSKWKKLKQQPLITKLINYFIVKVIKAIETWDNIYL